MTECFVIMPLTTPSELVSRYGGDEKHFLHVLEHLFVPAIKKAGLTPRTPIAEGGDLIHAEIIKNLETADLVLCDISALNANVFFELGIRTALSRTVCLVKDEHTPLPFDIGSINCHTYQSAMPVYDFEVEVTRLAEHVTASARHGGSYNPLWAYFGLTQRGTDANDQQGIALDAVLDEIRKLGRKLPVEEFDPPVTAAFRTLMDEVLAMLPRDIVIVDVTRYRYEIMITVEKSPSARILSELRAKAVRWGFDLNVLEQPF